MLTNRHVVGRFSEVKVKFNDGRELPASVVGRTSDLDVALLQLQGLSKNANEPSLPLCVRKPASVGEDIIVIGNPLGLQATTTRGIVSGVRSDDGSTLIQIDAPVNPGNSGGPVINYNGEVIGIVTAKQVAIGVEGIGYAIGIASALESLGVGYKDYVSGPNSAKSKLTQCNNLIR
jgi:serine protease Do